MKQKILMFFLSLLPHNIAHKILYRIYSGKKLNLNQPITLNEKIQWLIVNEYGEREALLTDKDLVKELIAKMNLKDLNIPKTLYVLRNADDLKKIDFDSLPNKFVIKCNHGSGNVFVCNNKSDFDKKIKILFKDLKKDFSKKTLEYHYKYIKPVILIEEFLETKTGTLPEDYKFFSYNGETKCVMVCTDRESGYKATFFDKDWNRLNYSTHEEHKNIPKPQNFEQMWDISEKLSTNHKFVRVDLYNINGKVYFGELTFTPAAGLSKTYTEQADIKLGSYLNVGDNK